MSKRVGITSIPREADLAEILKATEISRRSGAAMTRPSADVAEKVRDPLWREVRPQLFFDPMKVINNGGPVKTVISTTAAAVAGSSTYCEVIARMNGKLA
jgi:hypothetical protein